jgi:hypothetical protein
MLRTFIQILALITTLESAIFLARGSLGLSGETIAALGGTYYDYNPHLVQSLAQQTADYRAGVILLVVAFSLQMWNTLWPIRLGDFGVSRKGALVAVAVGLVMMITALSLTNAHSERLQADARGAYERMERKAPVLR